MPASDCLQPPLTPAERAIVKSYGGWTFSLANYGLKPWNTDDAKEGKQILEGLGTSVALMAFTIWLLETYDGISSQWQRLMGWASTF
ncbi:hypothetical protein DTO166G4_7923 [Paecilomyces variotii]|nr:hypothetical protein DTO166G4_7923 [Paecilomyces variotii]KAJ9228119.1 hypothetical protein DTO166G5_8834 [Paecilomyces variotii]KAJ9307610.1 hypothetical protein DTO217A2_2844 [Paecilomyces variotii]